MNKKALSLAICVAMALPTASNALSLGDIESNSSLNQPFRGKINLLSSTVAEAKTLRVRVASPEVFNRVGIDRPAFLNSIRFRVAVQNGKPVILVSSNQPINEPFLNFLLEVSWPNGQLLKEYTVLLDPPVLIRPDTAIASNAAGVRPEPARQARIARPVVQQQRTAPRRVAPQRSVQLVDELQTPAQKRQFQQLLRQVEATAAQRKRVSAQRNRANSAVRSYRVKRGDTLANIARKLAYRGVSNDKMMVALFEKNRGAFAKKNMNNLKAGAFIKRPSLKETRALTTRQAKAQILAQAREWKQTRAKLLADKKNGAGKKGADSKQQARLEVMGGKETVKASSAQSIAGNASVDELRKQLSLANEALTTRQKENEDLKSRVFELQSLLRKKNTLISLKSEQLAKLQESLSSTSGDNKADVNTTESESSAPTESPTSVGASGETGEVVAVDTPEEVTEAVVNEGIDIQQQVANNLANENGEIIRGGEEQLAIVTETPDNSTTQPEVTENQPEVTQTPAPVVENNGEESFDVMSLLNSPMAMGIGGGSLLALLGGLWFMRRRKADEYQAPPTIETEGLEEETAFDDASYAEASTVIDESQFVEHDIQKTEQHADEALETNEQDDLLQEADVYIVYGLHDQAESELKQAIEKDPGNLAYRAKLLENYKAAGDKEAFETEAKAFMEMDAEGKEPYLDDIVEWGSALLPESKLFSKNMPTTSATEDTGVEMVAGTAQADEIQEEDALIDLDDEFEGLVATDYAEDDTDAITDDLESVNLDDLLADDEAKAEIGDIDLDDNTDAIKELESELNESMDFDLDDDPLSQELEFDLDSTESLLDEPIDINSDSSLSDDLELDTDLELSNLNLDLDSDDFEKIMPEENAYKKESKAKDLDTKGSKEELADNLLADFDDNLSFLDLDDKAEVIEETQIDTKLDLAKAYIDMGDIEGARSTLEEVLQEGSDEQKREAEELLHQTG